MQNKNGPQRLIGEVQLLRIRSAAAESRVKALRAQAQEAKRRRKEAKKLAQRARKLFRRSKDALFELKQALAKAEEKLLKAGGRALVRKIAKPATAARQAVRSPKRVKVPAPKARRTLSRASSAPVSTARRKPAVRRIKAVVQGHLAPIIPEPKAVVPRITVSPSTDYE